MDRSRYVRPSAAGSWSKCVGYAALSASLGAIPTDEADNEVREDGTACHWLAAEIFEGRLAIVGSFAPNGRELTQEMFDAAEDYVDYLRSLPFTVDVEKSLPVSSFIPGCCDGTPDAIGYHIEELLVDVHDLKFGFRPVEVWENLQLLIYAYTKAMMLRSRGFPVENLRLTIHQPRIPHPEGTVRSWRTTLAEVEPIIAMLKQRAMENYGPDPQCTPGDHCRDCEAARGCRALQTSAGHAMEVSYSATPFELTTGELAYELANLLVAQKRLEARITGLTVEAEHAMRSGRMVPGFAMEPAATRYRWNDDFKPRVLAICQLFNVEATEEPKLKSPSKLSKLLPKGTLAPYMEKPLGERKLKMLDKDHARRRFTKK